MRIVLWNGTDEINIPKLRNQGYLIFLYSEEPYFYAYKKYFRYVNGFITNKGHYWLICHTNRSRTMIKKSIMVSMPYIVHQTILNMHH